MKKGMGKRLVCMLLAGMLACTPMIAFAEDAGDQSTSASEVVEGINEAVVPEETPAAPKTTEEGSKDDAAESTVDSAKEVSGLKSLGVTFSLVTTGIAIGETHMETCEFDAENPDKTFQFTASDFAQYLKAGYSIQNPDQTFEASYVQGEDGKYVLTPSSISIEVQKNMPEVVPVLNVEYRVYSESFSNVHYGDYQVVYTGQIGNLTMSPTSYSADTAALAAIGYQVIDDMLNPAEKMLSLNCYDDASADPDFHTPWIPSTFLEWRSGMTSETGNVPFPVSGDTIAFVVERTGTVEGDNQVNVGFKTEDGKVVGYSTTMEVDPTVGTLTVDQSNMPALPSGYSMKDQNESHTVTYAFNGESWALSEKDIYFTVTKNASIPVVNPTTPVVPTQQAAPPAISESLKTITKTTVTTTTANNAAKTGDTQNTVPYIILACAAICMAGGAIVIRKKREI